MKIITAGLAEQQRLEAVVKGARVDEHRARAMLEGQGWDAIVVDGNVTVGPSVFDAAADRNAESAAAGEVVALAAHALFGDAHSVAGSSNTLFVTPAGGERTLVRG